MNIDLWTFAWVVFLHIVAVVAILASDELEIRVGTLVSISFLWMTFGPAIGRVCGWW